MITNLAVAATLAVAASAVATPQAHADDLASVICERLATQNLWEVVHYLSWKEHIALVPTMIPMAFQAVHEQCPELSWRLPTPSAPAPTRPAVLAPTTPAPEDHEFYGDEPWRYGNEEMA